VTQHGHRRTSGLDSADRSPALAPRASALDAGRLHHRADLLSREPLGALAPYSRVDVRVERHLLLVRRVELPGIDVLLQKLLREAFDRQAGRGLKVQRFTRRHPFFRALEKVRRLRTGLGDRDLRIAPEIHAVLRAKQLLAVRPDTPFTGHADEERPIGRAAGPETHRKPRDPTVRQRRGRTGRGALMRLEERVGEPDPKASQINHLLTAVDGGRNAWIGP
jgi:alkanesulfonate monooxygenase SsuD/methylene tetrahydromethanopterin reductase-like flavin-dependent oxidoreductase (luciferase family)